MRPLPKQNGSVFLRETPCCLVLGGRQEETRCAILGVCFQAKDPPTTTSPGSLISVDIAAPRAPVPQPGQGSEFAFLGQSEGTESQNDLSPGGHLLKDGQRPSQTKRRANPGFGGRFPEAPSWARRFLRVKTLESHNVEDSIGQTSVSWRKCIHRCPFWLFC